MKSNWQLRTGVVGTTIAAICCATPALVLLLGAAGLSAWVGWWLDYFVLFPALGISLALIAYGLYRRSHPPVCKTPGIGNEAEAPR